MGNFSCTTASNSNETNENDADAYIIHLINSSNIPTKGVDLLDGIQAYCKIKVKTSDGNNKKTSSNQFTECKTTIRHSSDEPAWNCYRKIKASLHDIIHIELFDEDWFVDDFLGVATLSINADIKYNELITLPFQMKSEFNKFASNVRLKMYKASDYIFPQKRIYFLRHGESEFNVAAQKTDLVEMWSKTDHPLTDQGIKQCEIFNNKMKTYTQENQDFNKAAIWSSPLCRTVQTALVSLNGHPMLTKNGILLTSNCREFKSIGGRDSTASVCGTDIRDRCFRKMKKYREDTFVDKLTNIAWDFNDTCSKWWSGLHDKSNKEIDQRFDDFVNFLRYRSEKNVIVVTHSVFIRYFFKRYLPKKDENKYYDVLFGEEYEKDYCNDDENEKVSIENKETEDEIDYNEKLVTYKLDNGGVIEVKVEFDDTYRDGIVVRDTKLMFDSKLKKRGKRTKSNDKE